MCTDNSNSLPIRGRPVHQPIAKIGNRSAIIFLTVCTIKRQPLLANVDMHRKLQRAWQNSSHWLVGRYVIMPDHLHLFCAPNSYPPTSLAPWISYWKRQVAFAVGGCLWQKNFWDVQLRSHESYEAKWEYVRANPVRAGLVANPEDWPYQGEISLLRWHG